MSASACGNIKFMPYEYNYNYESDKYYKYYIAFQSIKKLLENQMVKPENSMQVIEMIEALVEE